jgi:hypothetical protein
VILRDQAQPQGPGRARARRRHKVPYRAGCIDRQNARSRSSHSWLVPSSNTSSGSTTSRGSAIAPANVCPGTAGDCRVQARNVGRCSPSTPSLTSTTPESGAVRSHTEPSQPVQVTAVLTNSGTSGGSGGAGSA